MQYEALLLAASLRAMDPGFSGRLFVAEPQPGPQWKGDPRMDSEGVLGALHTLGAEVLRLDNQTFGQSYPQGNKIEALALLPEGEPFLFLDSDTLITGALSALPFDFDRPTASMRRTGTWPEITLYGPGYGATWGSLYEKFGLDFASSQDSAWPEEYWQRYLYFNAGWFLGPCPRAFGSRYLEYATVIRDDPPEALVCQTLDPWLDQVALPLVIHALEGGRPGPELDGMDGDVTCHWRVLPLAYAREDDRVIEVLEAVTAPNKLKKVFKEYDAFKRIVYQGKGAKVRALFDRNNLPRKEQAIRNRIKSEKLWLR